jgi:pyridoxamine 5'-phosphate oxidase
MSKDISSPDTFRELRQEYSDKPLRESDVLEDPFKQFEDWFDQACTAGLYEPNAMVLSTVDSNGIPSSRVVLFKGLVKGAFSFYTHYTSKKGGDIAASPHVSLLFYWPEIHRQVRIQGTALAVEPRLSDDYFASRPRGAQVGAVASKQSEKLADRAVFETAIEELTKEYQETTVPRPSTWGGYGVTPSGFEFWQGRRGRLHDRIVYELQANGGWGTKRLYP